MSRLLISRAITTALLLTSLALGVSAQISAIPSAMNFQGRLATPSGNPVPDGTYSIRFSLWNVASGGTATTNEKWTQTLNTVAVKNGTFAVTLDVFPAHTFNGNLYLEVKIGEDAALSPRTALVTVPYAFKSDLALTVPDGSITASKLASDARGLIGAAGGDLIGTYPNPTIVNNAVTNGKIADNAVTSGKIAFDPASLSRVSNTLLSIVSGSLGIDQQNLVGGNGFGALTNLWQSFTPSVNGSLVALDVFLAPTANTAPINAMLSIYDGQGTGGTLLLTQPFQVYGSYGSSVPKHIVLQTPIAQTSGRKLTWAVSASANMQMKFSAVSAYTGGVGNNGYPYLFRTFVTTAGTPLMPPYSSVVVNGGFTPSAGNSSANGIQFPSDPGGGGSDAAWIRYYARTGEETVMELGTSNDATDHIVLMPSGNVGINTTTPSYRLDVNGTLRCFGFTNSSDARYKIQIAPFNNALNDVLNLRGVTYNWDKSKWPAMDFADGKQFGFIAQEVEKIFPELVSTDKQGYKSVNYIGVIPVLVESVKTLNARTIIQQKQIDTLTTQVKEMEDLKARFTAMEAMMAELKTQHK